MHPAALASIASRLLLLLLPIQPQLPSSLLPRPPVLSPSRHHEGSTSLLYHYNNPPWPFAHFLLSASASLDSPPQTHNLTTASVVHQQASNFQLEPFTPPPLFSQSNHRYNGPRHVDPRVLPRLRPTSPGRRRRLLLRSVQNGRLRKDPLYTQLAGQLARLLSSLLRLLRQPLQPTCAHQVLPASRLRLQSSPALRLNTSDVCFLQRLHLRHVARVDTPGPDALELTQQPLLYAERVLHRRVQPAVRQGTQGAASIRRFL